MGLRSGRTRTIVPSFMVRVTPARAARRARGSRPRHAAAGGGEGGGASHVHAYAGGVKSRWSIDTAQSKPRSSARRRYRPIASSVAVFGPSANEGRRSPYLIGGHHPSSVL